MQFKALVLSAIAATGVIGQLHRECGTAAPTEEQFAIAEGFMAQEEEMRIAGNETYKRATIAVKVYFHVLASSTAVSGGYLSVSFASYPMCS